MARKKKDLKQYGAGTVKPVLGKDGAQKTGKSGGLLWAVRISLGTDPVTKVVRQKQERFEGTEKQAYDHAAAMREEASGKGLRTEDQAQTFSGFIPIWAASLRLKNRANEKTIADYLQKLAHMERYIGKKRMEEVTERDIEAALVSLKNEVQVNPSTGRKTTLGNSSLHKVYQFTKRVFKFAHVRGYISRNPFELVDAPTPDKARRRSLTVEECRTLRAKMDEKEAALLEEYGAKEQRQTAHGNLFGRGNVFGLANLSALMGVRIAAATGMRRGEVCALLWEAVDLERGTVEVCRTLTEEMVVKDPKTKAGFRTITLDADTLEKLRWWKARQKAMLLCVQTLEEGALVFAKQTTTTPVVCNGEGGLFDPTHFERFWLAFRKEAGFPDLKLHELRHTAATMQLSSGIDIATVSRRLGHSKASTTLDFYAHALPTNDEKAADVMARVYAAKPQPVLVQAGIKRERGTA
ncbi:MAG: tyrosine-type recombinase/integrase [Coriobacteriia bacterium]|nr:tyrosine-type recombinase/integrase [Coriobacteriia bacterium]